MYTYPFCVRVAYIRSNNYALYRNYLQISIYKDIAMSMLSISMCIINKLLLNQQIMNSDVLIISKYFLFITFF